MAQVSAPTYLVPLLSIPPVGRALEDLSEGRRLLNNSLNYRTM